MRRYDIASGIILILTITDFALTVPVLVQEKRQARVDVVHIPKDVITLGKRGAGEGAGKLEMMVLDYFKTGGKQVESSDTHASSSSALPGPNHGSTDVGQAPGSNPASSTGPSVKGVSGNALSESDGEFHDVPLDTPPLSEHGSDHGLTGAHDAPLPKLPNPNLRPSTDPEFDWNYWMNLKDPPSPRPASQKEFGQASHQVGHVQQPNPGPSAHSDFDWNYWQNLEDLPPPRPAPSKTSNPNPSTKSGVNWKYWLNPLNLMDPLTPAASAERLASSKPLDRKPLTKPGSKSKIWLSTMNILPTKPQAASSKFSNPKPFNPGAKLDSQSNLMAAPKIGGPKIGPSKIGSPGSPKEPEDKVVPGPPPSPDPLDHQSSSADSQPVDLQAAIYAAKGKAKESRRISGTARDLENTVQNESQPTERPLDPEDLKVRNPGSF